MTREECLRLWKAEEREPFQGWDFSHLNGRWEAEELPWNYQEELEPYLNYRTMLLDMGTGGGEFLLSLNPPKGRTDLRHRGVSAQRGPVPAAAAHSRHRAAAGL